MAQEGKEIHSFIIDNAANLASFIFIMNIMQLQEACRQRALKRKIFAALHKKILEAGQPSCYMPHCAVQHGRGGRPMSAKTTAKTIPFQTVDADKVLAAQQRNIDAFANASQIVVDGAKVLAQRQSEMMQSSVDQWMAASQGAMTLKPGEFVPADQLTKVKSAYETAVANAKEMTEIAMKAQSEATSVLTKCFMANIEDMKAFAKIG
jgi:phasin family protein